MKRLGCDLLWLVIAAFAVGTIYFVPKLVMALNGSVPQ